MSRLVSIVMPCRNEADHLALAVRDAFAQERHGSDLEVLLAVGPSTDGTEALAERLTMEHPGLRVLPNPAGVVPHGLNAAIRAAQGEVIVRMDVHSRYPADYVATLLEALDRTRAENVGGVWETVPADASDQAWAIAQVLSSPLGVGNAHFRLGTGEEREVDTVPYGCWRRSLFDRIGFFDEELLRNQDDEFNGRIIRNGGRIVLLPQVRIRYTARRDLGRLWRMYREYGLFKPLVNRKLGAPATLRQFVPPLFVLALIGVPVLFLLLRSFGTPVSVVSDFMVMLMAYTVTWTLMGIAVYAALVLAASTWIALRARRISAMPWLVAAFMTVHVAYGVGYWQGLWRFVLMRRILHPADLATNR